MPTPEDILDQLESDLESELEYNLDEIDDSAEHTGVDRRQFMFQTLVAAAATTFGARAAQAQRALAGGELLGGVRSDALLPELAIRATGVASGMQPQEPAPLGNGEPPAEQFMPYPGGTGALMEKLISERGAGAFARSTFEVEPFVGAVPTNADDLCFLPAHRLAALIRERKITSAQLTDAYLDRLKRLDPTLLCAVTIMENSAKQEAARADAELAAGNYRGPLHGLPYGLKDLFNTKGVPTTWGAPDFKDRIIDDDAEIVVRLRDAGAVLLAKLSTGLFAQNDQWFRGRTNNPWNLSIGASGSSAGPGSATAAGCVAFSIGTETQGSIVSPSIRNGISALRPTFGRVSRTGGMVLSWSMDRVGPMCRTVEDCAMVFNAIHGADPRDPSTVTTPFAFNRNIDLAALRVGVDPNAPAPLVEKLRELGMQTRDIGARPRVPGAGSSLNVEYAAAFDSYVQQKAKEIGLDLDNLPPADAPPTPRDPNAPPPSPMARADWNPRFVRGRTVAGFDFLQTQRRRYMMVAEWGEFMADLDLFIASPTGDIGANAQTGHPCTVLPYAFDVPQFGRRGADDAPSLNPQPICGVITGALYNDDVILSVAHQFQKATDFHSRRPTIS